ncbi:hypothetical protein C8J57DRAFT_1006159, partial [Mycena rebaudengoi]
MPGKRHAHILRNENLKRARATLHPPSEPSSAAENNDEISAPSILLSSPQNMTSDLDDSDEEEISDDHLLVSEVGDIMTTFIQLEASGTVPLWRPECDSEIGMQEDISAKGDTSTEGALESFAQSLQRCHDEARKAELRRRRINGNDRSAGYSKNSKKTLQRQRKKRVEYMDKGGVFIHQYMDGGRRTLDSNGQEVPEDKHEEFFYFHMSQPEDFPGPQDDTSEKPQEPIETVPSPSLPPTALPHPAEITPQDVRAHLDQIKAAAADLDTSERALNALTWRDIPALKKALKGLSLKAKDKRIDVFFRTRITSMVATINLYLDENVACTWRQASLLAAKAQGRGINHARNL